MKTKPTPARDIDAYIAAFPEAVQAILENVRRTVREAAPAAREAIKYQIPTFTLNGNLVHFGAFKKHIGFYPAPRGAHRMARFSAYAGEKGTATFPLDAPIPYAVIREMVKLRVEEDSQVAAPRQKPAKAAAPARKAAPAAAPRRKPAKKAARKVAAKKARVRNAKAPSKPAKKVSGKKKR